MSRIRALTVWYEARPGEHLDKVGIKRLLAEGEVVYDEIIDTDETERALNPELEEFHL